MKMTIFFATIMCSLCLARQDCGVPVKIVYPSGPGNSCISSNQCVRIVYPENSCVRPSIVIQDSKVSEKPRNLEREMALFAARELAKREKEASEAAEREKVRKFVENQKLVQVHPDNDEFKRWKVLREVSRERNSFEEWRENNPSAHAKPTARSLKEENESFVEFLRKHGKNSQKNNEEETKKEAEE